MSRYFQPISVSELKDKLEAGAKKRQITERGSVYQEWFETTNGSGVRLGAN